MINNFGMLRAVILQDSSCNAYVIQGLEVDYAAQGSTIEEARKNFEYGLAASLFANQKMFNHVDNFLVAAPPDVWWDCLYKQRAATLKRSLSHTFHSALALNDVQSLPFENIEYFDFSVDAFKE